MSLHPEVLWLLPLAIPGAGILVAITLIDMGGDDRFLVKARLFGEISRVLFFGYLGIWWTIYTPPGLRFETESASRIVGFSLLIFAAGYLVKAVKYVQLWRRSD